MSNLPADSNSLLWAYVALAALAALALVASNWPKWGKALLVLGVTGLYFFAHQVLLDVWGWPSREAMPERFVLLATVIEEPSPKTAGALYVWVNALEDGKPVAEPRAFKLPYSKEMHSDLSEAMKKVRQGVSQMGTTSTKAGSGTSWLRPGGEVLDVKIRDMPVPQLPEK
ncbi:hypothetical protein JI742_10655 [Piscinibacter sp. Jin2]|uniref:Uncharacterized protein n=1 Tax=Aquariibacter lacus TaxID=2801332 RepID=A0A9X1BR48_9BURK|nr:hypothetical protein [Piscinibacter lacus]MBL0720346.1 hypothetical protein [Piscinibacter lacus]